MSNRHDQTPLGQDPILSDWTSTNRRPFVKINRSQPPDRASLLGWRILGLSRPGGFHLQPLLEPDVNLSAHPVSYHSNHKGIRQVSSVRIDSSWHALGDPGTVSHDACAAKIFELSPNPLDEIPIDIPPYLPKTRGVESSVIREPASEHGIEHP